MSSSSTLTSTTVNGRQVISGLSSGIDVDSMVQSTLSAEKWKLNKLQQQEQLTEWRQTAYRSIISSIQSFTTKYFDLTSSTSILSTKNLQKFTTSSTNSSAVTATAGTTASAGSHKLTVSQLATAATLTSSNQVTKSVQGTAAADFTAASGSSFVISLDGTAKTVTLNSSVTDLDSFQTLIDEAVGAGKVTVSTDNSTGALVIDAASDSGVQAITISAPATSSNSALSALGFGSDAVLSNRLSTSSTLDSIASQLSTELTFNSDGQVDITINGVNFTFDKSSTLSEVMTEVNQGNAGARLSYDELSGKFSLTADSTGAGNTLAVSESDSNFLTVFLNKNTAGQDAKLTLDGQTLTRSTNSVNVDGITYSLKDTTTEAVTIGIEQDVDGIYDTISNFVTDYNALIDTINSTISEEYDSDYPPLTDDQKEEMTDDEIENWEAKAKVGILRNDSLMQNFVTNMRSALMDSVSGVSTNLSAIGITTSTYSEKGKLHIDEDKLRTAIADNPEGVTNLFTQQSTSYSGTTTVRALTSAQRQTRYKEEGLSYRIYDILQDNISTIRDSSGNKGLMLLKAGTENDTSDTENSYSKELDKYSDKIEAEKDRLDDEEDRLYEKYTAMETYLNQLSSQFSALSSFTSSSSS